MGRNPRQQRARAIAKRTQQEIEAYRKIGYSTAEPGSPPPSVINRTPPKGRKCSCPTLNVVSPLTSRVPPAPPRGSLPYSLMVRRTSHTLFPKPKRRLSFPPEGLAYPGDLDGHPDIIIDREVQEYKIRKFFEGIKTPTTSPRV